MPESNTLTCLLAEVAFSAFKSNLWFVHAMQVCLNPVPPSANIMLSHGESLSPFVMYDLSNLYFTYILLRVAFYAPSSQIQW